MRFHLDEEQTLIQDTLRQVARETCTAEVRRRLIDQGRDFDSDVWAALSQVGLHGLLAPDPFGGSGLGLVEAALAMEALGEAGACGPFLGQMLVVHALSQWGSPDVQARWLSGLASGEVRGTVVFDSTLIEDWAGAVDEGRLNAQARFVAGAEDAELYVVGVRGGGLVLLEAGPLVEVSGQPGSDLTRRLSSVRIAGAPCTLLSDDASHGQALMDAALVLLAADALGGAQHCLDLSVDYAQTRRQFDAPIGQFQAVKHQLAEMALEVEPARALVWYAAYAQDAGLAEASRMAAHAKAHLADRFMSVARAAIQAHGGIGYTWEYDLQLWFRRALFDRAFLGSPSVHRERAAMLAGW